MVDSQRARRPGTTAHTQLRVYHKEEVSSIGRKK